MNAMDVANTWAVLKSGENAKDVAGWIKQAGAVGGWQ